jgi:hypothetical protein
MQMQMGVEAPHGGASRTRRVPFLALFASTSRKRWALLYWNGGKSDKNGVVLLC